MRAVSSKVTRELGGNDVEDREERDPDDIDEVPVERSGFDRFVVVGGELAAHASDEDDGHEDDAAGDVRAVEPGEREEGGAEDGVARIEGELRVVVHLHGEEDAAQDDADEETPD